MDISVVIPEYGCRASLQELYRQLTDTLTSMNVSYELVFVDDKDPQNAWEEIEELCKKDSHVIGIHFTRNFGQERAILAGMCHTKGNWVVVMDGDLQDPPSGIRTLYEKASEGYEVVFVRRKERKADAWTLFLSKLFYKFYNLFSDIEYDPEIGNFSIASRRVIHAYTTMRERNRGYIMFLGWLGYKSTTIDIEAQERAEGKSSYTFGKKMKYAIQEITSQSNKPLYIAIYVGLAFASVSLIGLLYLLIRHFIDGSVPEGWISIMMSIYLVGGLLLSLIGVHGIYVGNIFDEVKDRPLYVIETVLNEKESKS